MRVTVLGGTGLLGRHLVPLLGETGHEVTVASRSADVKADLTTGVGLAEAVEDADLVVHLASDARKPDKVDVSGTRNLLDVLEGQHLFYMSIVGVDRHPFAYYRAKHQAEQLIESSDLKYTILRATQFHDFVDHFLGTACRPPIALIPKRFVFQPVDAAEVASELATLIHARRIGLQPDFAGPTIHNAEHLARTLMEAKGRERPIINLPVPGNSAKAFKLGVHTNADRAVGRKTWVEFLDERYSPSW
jgi:uncharacterized protein YbjT (DUF2867 family)